MGVGDDLGVLVGQLSITPAARTWSSASGCLAKHLNSGRLREPLLTVPAYAACSGTPSIVMRCINRRSP